MSNNKSFTGLSRASALAALVLAAGCGSPTPAERLDLARQAVADGEPRTADIHLKNLLQEQPEHEAARSLLGEVSLVLGDYSAAESHLRRAVGLGADEQALQLPLIRALAAQGKHEEVLEHAEAGPALAGEDRITSLRMQASAHRSLGAAEAAEATYRAALELDPESPAVRADLARLLMSDGRDEEAARLVADVLAAAPEFPPALLLRGAFELRAERHADAGATFREVMRLETPSSPDYNAALAQLVEVLLAQGEVDDAEARANELLERNPNSPPARYLKARVEVERGDVESAERRLEEVIADAPRYAPANRLLGAVNLEQGQLGQARLYLQTTLASDPNDSAARLLLAEIHLREGDIGQARELLADAVPGAQSEALMLALAGRANLRAGDADRAAEFFEQSERTASMSRDELIGLSTIYVGTGQMDRAVRLLERASVGEAGAEDEVVADYLLALIRVRQGDYAGADVAARNLVESEPEAAWPSSLRGTIAVLREDLPAAREHYDGALAIDPEHVPSLLNLARAEVLSGDMDAAAANLRRVVEIEPDRAPAILGLAELALSRGDAAEAKEWLALAPESPARVRLEGSLAATEGRDADAAERFARAFEMQPSTNAALRAFMAARQASLPDPESILRDWLEQNPEEVQAAFALGTLALEDGDETAAIAYFESVLEANPDHPGALNNLAWLYNERGEEGALEMAARAHEAAPDNAAIADTLGWLYVQRDDSEAALPYLDQAVQGAPEHPEIRYHWAVALAETGDAGRAAEVLAEVLAEGGAFAGREDAERRLGALERTP